MIDEEVIAMLGSFWYAIENVQAAYIFNASQTYFYIRSDGKGNHVWSCQPFVGLRTVKGQLTYTFMFCVNADGSFLFTPLCTVSSTFPIGVLQPKLTSTRMFPQLHFPSRKSARKSQTSVQGRGRQS